jgi:aryl-alcohol dehydrogenase-like predicted oxidoreductase
VFLQGLLLNDAAVWPEWVSERRKLVQRIEDLSRKFGRKSRTDLCIAYVRSFQWVATLVLGAETLHQLEQLMPLASEPALTQQQTREIRAAFADVPQRLLNPARWNT